MSGLSCIAYEIFSPFEGFMAEKKKQHLVPACYLKSFTGKNNCSDVKNKKYENGVYVSSKTLDSGWKIRGIRNDIFTKSYYYNLTDDDINNPIIETFLSTIESEYNKHLNSIINKCVSNEVLSFISYFVTLQYMRVEKFMDMSQDTLDQLGEWVALASNSVVYDSSQSSDLLRLMLAHIDVGHVPYQNSRLIYNNTQFPFITSDNPVIKKLVNKRDLELVMPVNLVNFDVNDNIEKAFYYFPLTPKIAYVSCELILGGHEIEFHESSLGNVFYLNYWSIINANKNIYSSIANPIHSESKLSEILKKINYHVYIKIYTEKYRIKGEGILVVSEDSNISFLFSKPSDASNLHDAIDVGFVEVIDKGQSVRGMRYCFIKKFDPILGLVEIESKFKF